MDYALLIYRLAPPSEPITDAEDRAGLDAHRALQRGAKADIHAIARLDGTEKARTVRRHGAAHRVTDGPFIETKEWLIGFYVVTCATEDEALAHARTICPDAHHAIEVRPVTWRR